MVSEAKAASPLKKLLLIDAVTWSDAYPLQHPLRDVGGWFARWLRDMPNLDLIVRHVETDLERELRDGISGVLLSGSPRDAWRPDPVNEKLIHVIHICKRLEIPFLGVCYGHQLLARALGAPVGPHPRGYELGAATITLPEAGQAFPMFEGVPSGFEALQSHQDVVLDLPQDAVLLATGDFAHIQGFHWNHLLMGVQFHPEHDPESLRFIWHARRDKWRDKVEFDLDHALDNLTPTPQGPVILRNFVRFFLQ